MNWIFFDALPWDYDVATPLTRPIGGSQSAMCYLAIALARRGHTVATVTGIPSTRQIAGVRCFGHGAVPSHLFTPNDTIVVVINGPAELAQRLRSACRPPRKLVFWTQHAPNQPAMLGLADPALLGLWDRLVCVSQWHRDVVQERLGVPLEHMDVLRNAVAPAFEHLFTDAVALAQAKSSALRLAYTSTPFRGLEVLVNCYPEIRRRHSACRLDVYSSMLVYGDSPEVDEFQSLYARCRATEGIDYHGPLPQPELAKQLAGVSILAYPNTFHETSCIAVLEALAAGALVVTSDLGALPETCGGWARLVPPITHFRTREQYELDCIENLDRALAERQANPDSFFKQRFEQVQSVTAVYTWEDRAAEWEAAATRWIGQHG